MNTKLIEIKNLSCKIGARYLVRDINWEIKQGEHWVVYGINGSGKTTLLSILAGYRHYTNGTLRMFGEELSNENILEIRKKIGWVSASFFDKYYSKESVLDIVLSGLNGSLGLDSKVVLSDAKKAKALLKQLQLTDKIYHGFDMLSKGQRQNVLIARAILYNPEILILDEPCTGLDVYNRGYLFNILEALAKNGVTIIYVTHYIEEVLPLFQKALLLNNGIILAKGDTSEVFHERYFEEMIKYPVAIKKIQNRYKLEINTEYDTTSFCEVIWNDR